MIDDARHDLAIEYVLGSLEGDAGREFGAWVESDPDLQALVDELRETVASLAHTAPSQRPSADLREKVLASVRTESAEARRPIAWLPWAVAAGLAIACVVLFGDRARLRSAAQQAQMQIEEAKKSAKAAPPAPVVPAPTPAPPSSSGLAGQLALAQAQAATYVEQIAELRDEIAKLRGRETLASMKLATLTAQVATFNRTGAMIVWDGEKQDGLICISNLPKPAPGKGYQLWVVDAKTGTPVSAGMLTIAPDGSARLSFKPTGTVSAVDKFAISIEDAAGVKEVTGPVILAGI